MRMFGWRKITHLCTTHWSVVLSLCAAAGYHGKHQPFWSKFLPPVKPQSKLLAAHMFACLSVTPGYPGVSPSVGFLTLPPCPPGSVLFILSLVCILQKQIFKYSKAKLGSASIWFLLDWLASGAMRSCYTCQPLASSPHEDAKGCISSQRQGCLMLWDWTGLSC